jgi:hypothetical protein
VIYDLRLYERQLTRDLSSRPRCSRARPRPRSPSATSARREKDLSVMQVRPDVLAAALYTRDGRLFATYSRAGVTGPPFAARPGPRAITSSKDTVVLYRPVVENGEMVGTVHLRGSYDPGTAVDYLTILLW